jgi:hypothetical protein
MVVSSEGRIMTIIVILFIILAAPAYPQCKKDYTVNQSTAMQGINNGINHYYQNLIIQDLAIAGQKKFQDISLKLDFQVDFITDQCRPGQIDISVMPVKVNCQPLFYQGYDISASLKPEKADLIFHIIHENGVVIDSITFYDIAVGSDHGLYNTQSLQRMNSSSVSASFERIVFQYSKLSYENFRDHVMEIDNYYAASMLADSAISWTQDGFLAENENYTEMLLRKFELDRILEYIDPVRFDPVFVNGEYDLNGQVAKFRLLSAISLRLKAIINYNPLKNGQPGYALLKNEILKSHLDHFDFYYHLAYNTDFRFVNFLNELARPHYTNEELIELYEIIDTYKQVPANALAVCSRMLARGLIERGKEFEMAGNQLRARTYYNSARELAQLLHLYSYQESAIQLTRKMNEAISSSYLEISKKSALRDNPTMAAQYFHDARGIFSDDALHEAEPSWILEYEKWLFAEFEHQVIKNIEHKNYKKAFAYLDEIGNQCQSSSTYKCPDLFHEWMRVVREGIYLQFLEKAEQLLEADEQIESEQVFRQAVDLRQKAGYRIEKNVLEARLEVVFLQIYYEDYYDEGLRNFQKNEFVSALYYFNKAEYLEKSGVSRPNSQLMNNRQESARQVILKMLSDGRLKAWAHDFASAESVLHQVEGMLTEYQFSGSDTLALLYHKLAAQVLRTECDQVLSAYDEMMTKLGQAEKQEDYILAHRIATEAVKFSFDNLKCAIRDEEAWYKKMRLEPLAGYQKKETDLNLLVYKSVPDYLASYQELKKYYNRYKLLGQGIVFTSLSDRVFQQTDPAFLTGMLEHYIYLRDYAQSLRLLHRMHELQMQPEPLKNQQIALAEALARRDVLNSDALQPWEILRSYAVKDKWYRTFKWNYKKSWLKETDWKIKYWPVIWKK